MSGPPSEGVLVLDKPAGMTSHDVVARVRRWAGTRKVGHAGTLDPDATGVLVLGVGRATRLLGHLGASDKEYVAGLRLGADTVTDDAAGEVLSVADPALLAALGDDQLAAAVAELTGPLMQRPSAVSAVKVAGVRAHSMVRAGETPDLAPRPVTVERFEILDVHRGAAAIDLDMVVQCSAGTYVRALARDLGARLGVGGHLTSLRRTRSGAFTLDGAALLPPRGEESAAGAPELIPLGAAAQRALAWTTVGQAEVIAVGHGSRVPVPAVVHGSVQGVVAVLDPAGALLAISRVGDGLLVPVAVFA